MRYILTILPILFFLGCSTREEVVYIPDVSQNGGLVSKKSSSYPKKRHKLKPYKVLGRWYYPRAVEKGEVFRGISSWYGPNFHGKLTANGEIYNMYNYTAASKILPMNTKIRVTNLNNGKSVEVRVNDRGPFVDGRILDLSYVAGKKIGLDKTGIAPIEILVLSSTIKTKKMVKSKKNFKKNGKIKIQIGAFKNLSGAKIVKNEFSNLSKHSFIRKIDGKFKVFIGSFGSYKEANNFKRKHNIKGFIID